MRMRMWVGLLLGLVWLLSPVVGMAKGRAKKKRYTAADIKRLRVQAKERHALLAQQKDKSYQREKAKSKKLEGDLKKGLCKSAKIKLKVKLKKGKLRAKMKKVRICVTSDRKGAPVILIDGKKKSVAKALKSVVKGLQKTFKLRKKDLKKSRERLKKLGKKIEKGANKAFDFAERQLKKKAEKFAKAMAKGMAMQVTSLTMRYLARRLGAAIAKSNGKVITKLRSLLSKSSKAPAQKAQKTSRISKVAKFSAKTALISAALAATQVSANVILNCWTRGGESKRACLEKQITLGMRDLVYFTVVNIAWFGLDAAVVEPLSHTLAASVAAALATGTMGAGALAYPIAYVASSAAMNGMVYASLETFVKPKWAKFYKDKAYSKVMTTVKRSLKGIPTKNLVCFAPKASCSY